MACVSMAMPITGSKSFFNPLKLSPSPNKALFIRATSKSKVAIEASFKEKVISGATAGVITAAMLAPDVAEAASSFSPSLKNFLLSIGAGGVVLVAIIGAVLGVSNFDPVKRA